MPDSLLKAQIPVRSWADWDDAVPGFVEIDLAGHDGGAASGELCFTLTVTDIATGWTINRSVRNNARPDLGTGRGRDQLLPAPAEVDLQTTQRRQGHQTLRHRDHCTPASHP